MLNPFGDYIVGFLMMWLILYCYKLLSRKELKGFKYCEFGNFRATFISANFLDLNYVQGLVRVVLSWHIEILY